MHTHHPATRLVFIGGGISATLTLQSLVQHAHKAVSQGLSIPNIHILVIDKHGDFGTGLPYGRFTSPLFLLQDPVRAIDTDILNFRQWLSQYGHGIIADLIEAEPRLSSWAMRHQAELDTENYDALHLPRLVFGRFMKDMLQKIQTEISACDFLKLDLVQGEVLNLERQSDDTYQVITSQTKYHADIVILTLGSPPYKVEEMFKKATGYINNIYEQDIDTIAQAILQIFQGLPPKDRRIIVQGANATAIEMLYFFTQHPELAPLINSILVLSPQGRLPVGQSSNKYPPYTLQYLPLLLQQKDFGAESIITAIKQDIAHANEMNYTLTFIIDAVQEIFKDLFNRLPFGEKLHFVNHYGAIFRSVMKRTSSDYSEMVQQFVEQGVIRLVPATITETTCESNGHYRVMAKNNNGEVYTFYSSVVINAMGWEKVTATTHPLLRSLISREQVSVNSTEKGLLVNAEFEASHRLFVMGPLLAGFAHGDDYVWWLESIPRISKFAHRLGATLSKNIIAELDYTIK